MQKNRLGNFPTRFIIEPQKETGTKSSVTKRVRIYQETFLPISYCFAKTMPISHEISTFLANFVLFCQNNVNFT